MIVGIICRWHCLTLKSVDGFLTGPKGRDSIAQGNALGRGRTFFGSPERAEYRGTSKTLLRPFRANLFQLDLFPRAMPWAIESRPFGPKAFAIPTLFLGAR
jgi:hypothetical protein